MKRMNINLLAASLLICGCMIGCSDDILIGGVDESAYDNVVSVKGSVRNARNGKSSTIVELFRDDYKSSVEFYMPRVPNQGVDVTIEYDEDYLATYNAEHKTSFKPYPKERFVLQNNGKIMMAPDEKSSYSLDITIPALDTLDYEQNQTYLLPLKAVVKTDGVKVSDKPCVFLVKNLAGDGTALRKEGEKETFIYFEVNDTNPLNALQWRMTDGRYLVNYLVLFAANINYDKEKGELYIYTNEQVSYILNHNEEIIQPLRKHGIKVLLGLLGNHDESGLAQLSDIGAKEFAGKLAAMCYAYNLDGVNFDDEYSNVIDPENPLLSDEGNPGARLMYESKRAMPDKYITNFQYSGMSGADYVDGVPAGEWLDISVANYKSWGSSAAYPREGMTKANCAGKSVEMARGGRLTVEDGRSIANSEYGYIMLFGPWAANNQGSKTQLGYLSNLAEGMYGTRLVDPEYYYPSSTSLERKPY